MQKRIEICGAIASGKTTFATMLEKFGYPVIYERFNDNPFISDFYKDNLHSNAFETESVFILLHSNLIRNFNGKELFVTDYSMIQDYCYGVQNLNGVAFDVFKNLYNYLNSLLPPVAKTIYLKCDIDTLMNRIQKRNRGMENTISRDYILENIKVIESIIAQMQNVLVIDSKESDLRDKTIINDIIKKINIICK